MIGILELGGLMAAVAIASWGGTGALRRYALKRSVIDVPNARSSHFVPTPRGGGAAIVLGFLLALPLLYAAGLIASVQLFALLGAGGLVALIGFLDDHGHIAARWRLLAHFLAAGWALFWMGGSPALSVFGFAVAPEWFGTGLAAVFLVWVLNLYNFMDGIDGIAGVEAISVCLGGALLFALNGEPNLAALPALLAAAVAGFLWWNFPPAKIFMGDAGSGFLGIVLGVLSLLAGWVAPGLLWAWLILLGVFVVDATWTLLRRLLRGERVYEAHRSHAYQRAARLCGRHLPVTLAVAAINLFWLLPLALCVGAGILEGVVATGIAYAPLLATAVALGAGEPEGALQKD